MLGFISAQEISSDITLEKQRLLVLPSYSDSLYESIASTVTTLVSSEATKLNRFIIIDHSNLEPLLEEQSLQMSGLVRDEDLVKFGEIASANDALVVRITNFGQKGVPPEEDSDKKENDNDDGLFSWVVKKSVNAIIAKKTEGVELYPNNIQTVLQGEVRKINVESGETMASFSISADHTGGNKTASLGKVLNRVQSQVSIELRRLYVLSSQVIDVKQREVTLLLGSNMGVKSGLYFELSSPDRTQQIGDLTVTIPGRSVGWVVSNEVSDNANRCRILRNWETIEPGFKATEMTQHPFAGGFNFIAGPDASRYLAQGFIDPFPFNRFSIIGEFGLGAVSDSWNDLDFDLKFGAQFYGRLIQTRIFSGGATLELPFDLIMRGDDHSHTVSLPVFAPAVGVRVEWMLSPHRDLILGVESILSSMSSTQWKYTEQTDKNEDSVTRPAEWDRDSGPEVDLKGLYITVGVRFFAF